MIVISRILQAAGFVLLLAACGPPRFQYSLRDTVRSPSDMQRYAGLYRRSDSLQAVSDSINHCPPRADTVWAGNRRVAIPQVWLEASVAHGCSGTGLPNLVRRRLRDDPASLPFYEAVARGQGGRDELARAAAVSFLGYSGHRRYFPLLLRIASDETPALGEKDYNAAYWATIALAPYLWESHAARRTVLRHAGNMNAPRAREAGIQALAIANSTWSRRHLKAMVPDNPSEYHMRIVGRALSHRPCRPGTVFVERIFIEGQDYSRCEPPPDWR
ncbi:hypothetical protein [Longimicrobium terrae]|uniref:Uncharacterized protein n=1 Tax=Longimicrobium terrae TaxID=1639882 RepID=A0A841GIM9_9BACT|nr:hypothetical protein [Longimicrobium terrae]MBB4634619.1 hypothetical protein [Longimicrobium terrae]MBB6068491.1 hypothetical protein [Longimicrobium terrae]NNC27681.1 hypothetical protein [Longimicrobium terrae]